MRIRLRDMSTDDTSPKLAWEEPATTPLTDTESRADVSDITLDNGAAGSLPG
jgi:hypothetical protein